MANILDHGGPAFPLENPRHLENGELFRQFTGMTLRDWFAGQALAGICAGLCSSSNRGDSAYDRVHFNGAAKDAYTIADAMLLARQSATTVPQGGKSDET